MRYMYQYDVAAIVINSLMLLLFILRNRHDSSSNRIFRLIIICNLLASVFDLISCFTISYPQEYSLVFNYIVSLGALYFYNNMAVLYFAYIDAKGKLAGQKMLVRHVCVGLTLFYAVVLLSSPWTHWVAYFDENREYGHGPLWIIFFLIPFVLFAWELYILLKARNRFNRYQVIASAYLVIGMGITVAVTWIQPSALVGQMVMALIMIFVYITYENPAYYCFGDSRCGNDVAFSEKLSRISYSKKPLSAVAFRMEDYALINSYFGEAAFNNLLNRVAERFYSQFKGKVYAFDSDLFVIFTSGNEDEVIRQVALLFENPVNASPLQQQCSFTPYRLHVTHEDASDIELVLHNIHQDITEDNFDEVLDKLETATIHRTKIERAIKRGLERDAFFVYYQPICNMKTGRFESAEALIRLIDEEIGFVEPEEMIILAEQRGLINEVGKMVFKKVCKFISQGGIEELGVKYIEVNTSTMQFMTPTMAEEFLQIMKEYQIRPDQINLELTETAETVVDEVFRRNLEVFNRQGVTLSIDDYGSGFASANYLIRYPISIVKIDREILWGAMKDANAMIVFKSTVRMIQELGKKIVVEGGETQEMISLLKEEGCDYCQGFFYSKPLAEEEYIAFLKAENR